jgi:hypothetical protein
MTARASVLVLTGRGSVHEWHMGRIVPCISTLPALDPLAVALAADLDVATLRRGSAADAGLEPVQQLVGEGIFDSSIRIVFAKLQPKKTSDVKRQPR